MPAWKSENRKPCNARGSIAVAGGQRRIGVTTQALQITGYLKMMGYSAAYVEMNNHGYVREVARWYAGAREEEHRVLYQDLDLYTKESLQHLRAGEYRFLVKDYGSCQEENFETVSFMEQAFLVYVCGMKPDELQASQMLLEKTYCQEAGYIFSFTAESERREILNMMEEKASKTVFSEYTPDPFLYKSSSSRVYRALLGI